jgi:transcriptional regulator with XRE-family HTH domain
MSFSEELRKKREALGLSIRAVEKGTKGVVSDSALCRYENGMGLLDMRFEHAQAISRFFDWDLSDMGRKLGREGAEWKEKLHGREKKEKTGNGKTKNGGRP